MEPTNPAQLHSLPDDSENRGAFWTADRWLWRLIVSLCGTFMLLTVIFTCYTVYMRYVLGNPPYWGDTVALFANIWMVMLALGVSVRTRDQIAMQALYSSGSPAMGFWLEVVWTLMILLFAIFLMFVGGKAALDVPGTFWELGELPKSYPMMILPISGFLVALAALAILVEDFKRWQRGDLTVKSGNAFEGGKSGE